MTDIITNYVQVLTLPYAAIIGPYSDYTVGLPINYQAEATVGNLPMSSFYDFDWFFDDSTTDEGVEVDKIWSTTGSHAAVVVATDPQTDDTYSASVRLTVGALPAVTPGSDTYEWTEIGETTIPDYAQNLCVAMSDGNILAVDIANGGTYTIIDSDNVATVYPDETVPYIDLTTYRPSYQLETQTSDGKVYFPGDLVAAVFNPTTTLWSVTSAMNAYSNGMIVTTDDELISVGVLDDYTTTIVEKLVDGTWTQLTTLDVDPTYFNTMTNLSDGRIFMVFYNTEDCGIFDPSDNSWEPITFPIGDQSYYSRVLVDYDGDDTILIVNPLSPASIMLYTISTGTWFLYPLPHPTNPQVGIQYVVMAGGKIFIIYFRDYTDPEDGWVYSISTGDYSALDTSMLTSNSSCIFCRRGNELVAISQKIVSEDPH